MRSIFHHKVISLAERRISLKKALLSKCFFLVEEGGFEPPKSLTADLQSAPFGHSGTLPSYFIFAERA